VRPPWPDGAVSADGAIVDIAGLRLAGLGGCRRYSDGPNQYTDRQQGRRARWLAVRAAARRRRDGRRVDVLLTHAPPRGVGDGSDPPHQGFTALHGLVARLRPALLLHGHVDPDPRADRDRMMGNTLVCNVTGWRLLTVEPTGGCGGSPPRGPAEPGARAAGDWPAGQYRA
jgi:Icc-related predicted phosphoesterase